jgi:hypothetical protein
MLDAIDSLEAAELETPFPRGVSDVYLSPVEAALGGKVPLSKCPDQGGGHCHRGEEHSAARCEALDVELAQTVESLNVPPRIVGAQAAADEREAGFVQDEGSSSPETEAAFPSSHATSTCEADDHGCPDVAGIVTACGDGVVGHSNGIHCSRNAELATACSAAPAAEGSPCRGYVAAAAAADVGSSGRPCGVSEGRMWKGTREDDLPEITVVCCEGCATHTGGNGTASHDSPCSFSEAARAADNEGITRAAILVDRVAEGRVSSGVQITNGADAVLDSMATGRTSLVDARSAGTYATAAVQNSVIRAGVSTCEQCNCRNPLERHWGSNKAECTLATTAESTRCASTGTQRAAGGGDTVTVSEAAAVDGATEHDSLGNQVAGNAAAQGATRELRSSLDATHGSQSLWEEATQGVTKPLAHAGWKSPAPRALEAMEGQQLLTSPGEWLGPLQARETLPLWEELLPRPPSILSQSATPCIPATTADFPDRACEGRTPPKSPAQAARTLHIRAMQLQPCCEQGCDQFETPRIATSPMPPSHLATASPLRPGQLSPLNVRCHGETRLAARNEALATAPVVGWGRLQFGALGRLLCRAAEVRLLVKRDRRKRTARVVWATTGSSSAHHHPREFSRMTSNAWRDTLTQHF